MTKGQRVEVSHETGIVEYGTVVAVNTVGRVVDVHFDDDTYLTVPAFRVRPFDGFDAWCATHGQPQTVTIDGDDVVR